MNTARLEIDLRAYVWPDADGCFHAGDPGPRTTADAAPSIYRTCWSVDGGFVAECGGFTGEWGPTEHEAMGSALLVWQAEGQPAYWSIADAWKAAGREWAGWRRWLTP